MAARSRREFHLKIVGSEEIENDFYPWMMRMIVGYDGERERESFSFLFLGIDGEKDGFETLMGAYEYFIPVTKTTSSVWLGWGR